MLMRGGVVVIAVTSAVVVSFLTERIRHQAPAAESHPTDPSGG